jgi:predicted dinucleotide-binding enzyme
MIERISILGTGLLGKSVGLTMRAAGFHGSIVGWNRGAEGAQAALSIGANDAVVPPWAAVLSAGIQRALDAEVARTSGRRKSNVSLPQILCLIFV